MSALKKSFFNADSRRLHADLRGYSKDKSAVIRVSGSTTLTTNPERSRRIRSAKIHVQRKSQLRDLIKHKLMAQSEKERIKKGLLIKEKLFSLEEFKRAKVAMFYVSTDGEVDTASMIDETLKMGKKVVVPLILMEEKKLVASQILDRAKELRSGPYGILQPIASCLRPISLKDIDLVIVPGIAFDKKGNRLGRGKGYYDKFLSEIPKGIPLIGLAFDFQLVDRLPRLAHDLPVDKVITA